MFWTLAGTDNDFDNDDKDYGNTEDNNGGNGDKNDKPCWTQCHSVHVCICIFTPLRLRLLGLTFHMSCSRDFEPLTVYVP